MTNFGIDQRILDQITSAVFKNQHVEKAVIYGSRARGDFKPHSDIDIAIYGNNLSDKEFFQMASAIEDIAGVFKTNIVHYERISSDVLKENIDREGVVLSTH